MPEFRVTVNVRTVVDLVATTDAEAGIIAIEYVGDMLSAGERTARRPDAIERVFNEALVRAATMLETSSSTSSPF